MSLASFGSKTFQVSSKKIYTFNGLTLGASLETEEQDVKGSKPSTHIKGCGLQTMSFSIPLNAKYGHNIKNEYKIWNSILESETAYFFILGGKPITNNKWLLINVSLSDNDEIDGKGNILKANLELEFKELARKSTQSSEEKKEKKKAAAKKKKSSQKSVNVANQILSLNTDKADKKRSNSNAAASIASGKRKG